MIIYSIDCKGGSAEGTEELSVHVRTLERVKPWKTFGGIPRRERRKRQKRLVRWNRIANDYWNRVVESTEPKGNWQRFVSIANTQLLIDGELRVKSAQSSARNSTKAQAMESGQQ